MKEKYTEARLESAGIKKPMTKNDCRKLAAVLIATWLFLGVVIGLALMQTDTDYSFQIVIAAPINFVIARFFQYVYREVIRLNGVIPDMPNGEYIPENQQQLLRVRPISHKEYIGMTIIFSAFLFSSCISMPSDPVLPVRSGMYHGKVTQYLQNVAKRSENITITYDDSIGSFESRGEIRFFDSIRAVVIDRNEIHGYLFPDNISFDSAWAWGGVNLYPINFTVNGDSLFGSLPPDRQGFKYSFSCSR